MGWSGSREGNGGGRARRGGRQPKPFSCHMMETNRLHEPTHRHTDKHAYMRINIQPQPTNTQAQTRTQPLCTLTGIHYAHARHTHAWHTHGTHAGTAHATHTHPQVVTAEERHTLCSLLRHLQLAQVRQRQVQQRCLLRRRPARGHCQQRCRVDQPVCRGQPLAAHTQVDHGEVLDTAWDGRVRQLRQQGRHRQLEGRARLQDLRARDEDEPLRLCA